MKSFAKLGLLLALVIAGRYLRPTSAAALSTPETNSVASAKPDTLHFATYATSQTSPVAPVNHRTLKSQAASDDDFSIWY